MRILSEPLDQSGVLERADDSMDAELLLEFLGLRLVAHEGSDVKCACARVDEQLVKDRASNVSCIPHTLASERAFRRIVVGYNIPVAPITRTGVFAAIVRNSCYEVVVVAGEIALDELMLTDLIYQAAFGARYGI